MKTTTIYVNPSAGQYITVWVGDGTGSIESNLFALDAGGKIRDCTPAGVYNAALDGILSLVLAQACAGMDVSDARYQQTVIEVVERVLEDYDFDE